MLFICVLDVDVCIGICLLCCCVCAVYDKPGATVGEAVVEEEKKSELKPLLSVCAYIIYVYV